MYRDRTRLHNHGYQHRCVKVIDRMLLDAWLSADEHVRVRGLTLAETCQDPAAHERLVDAYVNFRINEGGDGDGDGDGGEAVPEGLRRARQILDRITRRDFYRELAEVDLADPDFADVAGMTDDEVLTKKN